MSTVSIREMRNQGASVLRAVESGTTYTVTRDGEPVAQLAPLPRRPLTAEELVRRRQHLPDMDPDALRADIDSLLDMSL